MKRPGSSAEHHAQTVFGTGRQALAFYNKQILTHLNPLMRDFIARQEFAFIATADARGECDCSFRAGPPGFVHVLDERTLAYPEYRGNGVLASIGNMLENAHIGLIFVDFVRSGVGLHVNGTVRLLGAEDALAHPGCTAAMALAARAVNGHTAQVWVLVEVHEAYIHCPKHIPRFAKADGTAHPKPDDGAHKGGDHFEAKRCWRPWDAPPDTASDPVHVQDGRPAEAAPAFLGSQGEDRAANGSG